MQVRKENKSVCAQKIFKGLFIIIIFNGDHINRNFGKIDGLQDLKLTPLRIK